MVNNFFPGLARIRYAYSYSLLRMQRCIATEQKW